mmetsp:Transcript_2541/g.5536  ORF Transcript_2541/g.5536 Transcript_2541/m.5536 type:complete len:134 (-) Transcript_2541:2187-2588(-)
MVVLSATVSDLKKHQSIDREDFNEAGKVEVTWPPYQSYHHEFFFSKHTTSRSSLPIFVVQTTYSHSFSIKTKLLLLRHKKQKHLQQESGKEKASIEDGIVRGVGEIHNPALMREGACRPAGRTWRYLGLVPCA